MSIHEAPQIPGLRGHLLLGSLREFRCGMLEFLTRLRQDYGPVARFRLGPRRMILISDPHLIDEVLVAKNKHFRKHYAVRLLKPVLGDGLLLSEGEHWLRQRRLIQPSFSHRFFQEFAENVSQRTSRLADKWRAAPQRDLYADMTTLTVQIASQAFLGVRDAAETEDIGDCLELIHADFESRFQQPWHAPYWVPTRRNRRLRRTVNRLSAIIDRMIEARRGDVDGRHDALSLLLQAEDQDGRRMPTQLLRDEVATLLLAGHDTTANALTWTWGLLAEHPEVMKKLRSEAAVWLRCQASGSADVERLTYTRHVIKESMRLFPPVYLFGREAAREVRIGDYEIRKGDSVLMSQWVVHRDHRFFSQPEAFQPDRWSQDFERSLPRYAYFPFGGGPRICIGREVAMMEAAIVLATLAGEFSLSLDDPSDLTPWPAVTLRPRGAVRATVGPVQPQDRSAVSA